MDIRVGNIFGIVKAGNQDGISSLSAGVKGRGVAVGVGMIVGVAVANIATRIGSRLAMPKPKIIKRATQAQ